MKEKDILMKAYSRAFNSYFDSVYNNEGEFLIDISGQERVNWNGKVYATILQLAEKNIKPQEYRISTFNDTDVIFTNDGKGVKQLLSRMCFIMYAFKTNSHWRNMTYNEDSITEMFNKCLSNIIEWKVITTGLQRLKPDTQADEAIAAISGKDNWFIRLCKWLGLYSSNKIEF